MRFCISVLAALAAASVVRAQAINDEAAKVDAPAKPIQYFSTRTELSATVDGKTLARSEWTGMALTFQDGIKRYELVTHDVSEPGRPIVEFGYSETDKVEIGAHGTSRVHDVMVIAAAGGGVANGVVDAQSDVERLDARTRRFTAKNSGRAAPNTIGTFVLTYDELPDGGTLVTESYPDGSYPQSGAHVLKDFQRIVRRTPLPEDELEKRLGPKARERLTAFEEIHRQAVALGKRVRECVDDCEALKAEYARLDAARNASFNKIVDVRAVRPARKGPR